MPTDQSPQAKVGMQREGPVECADERPDVPDVPMVDAISLERCERPSQIRQLAARHKPKASETSQTLPQSRGHPHVIDRAGQRE
jgi:hypothetical protein